MAQGVHCRHKGRGHKGAVVEPKSVRKSDAMGRWLYTKRCKSPLSQGHDAVPDLEVLHPIANPTNDTCCLASEPKGVAGGDLYRPEGQR